MGNIFAICGLVVSVVWSSNVFAAKPIGNPDAPVGGTVYYNLSTEPTGLNPLKGFDGSSTEVTGYAFDSLLTRNIDTYEFEPALAEKYEVAKDGKSITFTLRDGAIFHDGSPVTIEDVKFSYDVNFDAKLGDVGRKMYFENFDRVEIVDKNTIKFYIKTPYFKNLETAATMEIVPKKIYGDPKKKLNKTMTGSGPYMLEKYDMGRSITLKRNPNWWGFKLDANKGFNKIDRIVFRFIKDETAKLESLKKGDLDYLGLTPEQYEKKTSGELWGTKVFKKQVENSAPKGTGFIGFNLRSPLFKDVEVRHALSELYNREFAIEKFFFGKYLPAPGPWYPQSPYADPNTKAVKFNPSSARKRLKAAGWADTDKDGVLDKVIDGKKVDFRFAITHGGGPWERFLTIYKEELKKSGIDVSLKQLEWNALSKNIQDWNFDMVAMAWGGAVEYDPKQIWHSSSIHKEGSNFAGYSNPKVDKLIDEARQEMNEKKRIKMIQKVYAMVAADHPYVFLYNPKYAFYGHTKRMQLPKPTYKYGIGSSTWWIKE
ncbi:MAG: peptide ABC transporter substrate-binding protein [Bdellovibrionales bacterium]|nr:peptide ABC transporter substrate-binding protein [Bdellovibrionales bacterium]